MHIIIMENYIITHTFIPFAREPAPRRLRAGTLSNHYLFRKKYEPISFGATLLISK